MDKKKLQQEFEKHRQRVLKAKAIVDHTSPSLHAGNYVGLGQLRDDNKIFAIMQKKQYATLVNVNQAARTQGNLNTFEGSLAAKFIKSKLQGQNIFLTKLEKVNEVIGQRILNAKAEVDSHQVTNPLFIQVTKGKQVKAKKKVPKFQIPHQILMKYSDVNLPFDDENLMQKLLRPKIFFEIDVQGTRVLGPIVMELYTEACPEVVLDFVRVCRMRCMENIRLVRSFPQLWLEGELRLRNAKIHTKNVEYDMRALDHGKSEGIMSMPHANLKGFPHCLIPFSISFKPLNAANGNRLAFGKVISGIKFLDSLKDYGTKNGKPLREMKIKNCGLLT